VNNASNRFEEHGTQIGRVGLTGATRGALGRAVGRYAISAIAVIASATTLISLAEGQGAFSFEVGLAAAWWLFWLLVLPGVPLFLVLILLLPRLEHWLPNTRVELLATAASFVIWASRCRGPRVRHLDRDPERSRRAYDLRSADRSSGRRHTGRDCRIR
jgi:hypothetical protein